MAKAPRIGRNAPVSESSPANSRCLSDSAGIWPLAARMPSAIGRSKRPDSFGRAAGGEVEGDAPHREVEAAVLQRGAHALAAFADFEIRQAHDRERRQSIREMDF